MSDQANKPELSEHNKELMKRVEQFVQKDPDLNASLVEQFLSEQSDDYRKPFIKEVAWSFLNDESRFKNLKLEPATIDIMELFTRGYVTQTVHIRPNFSVQYRSAVPRDDAFLQAWGHVSSPRDTDNDLKPSDAIKFIQSAPSTTALNELALFVVSINGVSVAGHTSAYDTDKNGVQIPSMDKAIARRDEFTAMSHIVVQDIILHLRAFEQRVMEVYNPTAVQNF